MSFKARDSCPGSISRRADGKESAAAAAAAVAAVKSTFAALAEVGPSAAAKFASFELVNNCRGGIDDAGADADGPDWAVTS